MTGKLFVSPGNIHIDVESKITLYFGNEQKGTLYHPDFLFLEAKKTATGLTVLLQHKDTPEITMMIEYAGEDGGIAERITIENNSNKIYENNDIFCGFLMENTENYRFCAIPFRRESVRGKLCDWSEQEFRSDKHEFPKMRNPIYNWTETQNESAEGWAVYSDKDTPDEATATGATLLVLKYQPKAIEFSVLNKGHEKGMIFGGASMGKMGDPQEAAAVQPGEKYCFGMTFYRGVSGGWKAAYSAFRDFMVKKGHTTGSKYNPRFVWNELYDNPAWYERDKNPGAWQDLLNQYYMKKDMELAAERAVLHGCRCLYLDPGWDTDFGSNIWSEERLGKMSDFSAELKEKYGLTLGLHVPLAPWSENVNYDQSERRLLENGARSHEICVMSEKYAEEKLERLKKLADDGAVFYLYDGSWYESPCFDSDHGHSVPSTRKEHIEAINRLAVKFHEYNENVVIEQHDSIIGPGTPRYLPLYSMMKADSGDPDEIWAFEFMNEPLEDFKSGRAYCMYYANLASMLPFYLHIDLRFDNDEGLAFWWFASTCRHLGIGGTDKNPEKARKQVEMANLYAKNCDYYSKGVFYGIDELTHAHTICKEGKMSSLIDFFNPTEAPVSKSVCIHTDEIGMGDSREICLTVDIPAAGHNFVII